MTFGNLFFSDKLNLDIFWLKDESLEDSANLPDPDIIAIPAAYDSYLGPMLFPPYAEHLAAR